MKKRTQKLITQNKRFFIGRFDHPPQIGSRESVSVSLTDPIPFAKTFNITNPYTDESLYTKVEVNAQDSTRSARIGSLVPYLKDQRRLIGLLWIASYSPFQTAIHTGQIEYCEVTGTDRAYTLIPLRIAQKEKWGDERYGPVHQLTYFDIPTIAVHRDVYHYWKARISDSDTQPFQNQIVKYLTYYIPQESVAGPSIKLIYAIQFISILRHTPPGMKRFELAVSAR